MSEEAQKKRGRKPLPVGERKIDTRLNVSMGIEAHAALIEIQSKLAKKIGFDPTISQTLIWLLRHSDKIINEA